ncbi:MAG: hypothetical protein Q6M04_12790 [Thermostichus sp. BF3_bins_97]
MLLPLGSGEGERSLWLDSLNSQDGPSEVIPARNKVEWDPVPIPPGPFIEMVKPGVVVIDIDSEAVKEVAAAITPLPGGMGPMTVTMLLHNSLESYHLRNRR